MAVSRYQRRPVAAPALRAAEEAYSELRHTWEAFRSGLAEALPQIIAHQTWREWLDDDELLRMRRIVGEWVVTGDQDPEHQAQVAAGFSQIGPRLAPLLPVELRAAYIRANELSAFLIEQMGIALNDMTPAPEATAQCACEVVVPPQSRCSRCRQIVCVLHSRRDPSRENGTRLCLRCASER